MPSKPRIPSAREPASAVSPYDTRRAGRSGKGDVMSPGVLAEGPAIELINVSRRFLTPDGKSVMAIRDFNMSVARGEFVAVVGPTGCGKSTTLNLVTGLAKPSSGEVRGFGARVDGIDPRIG